MPTDRPLRIVVVDDEKYICNVITEALSSELYQTVSFCDPAEGLAHIASHPVDLVLSDLVMGDYNGLQILDAALQNHRDAIVILMTAHPTVETAIAVLKKGAYDFLVKPFKLDLLKATIRRGLEHQQVLRDNMRLREQVEFLKVAHAGLSEVEIEDFMRLLVNSCRKELNAAAAAMIEINPESKDINRQIYDSVDPNYQSDILHESTFLNFFYTKRRKPVVKKTEFTQDGEKRHRTFITQPIFIRGKLHGVINILIIDRFDELTGGQMDILTLLTSSASSALSNFLLYQELQNSYLQAIIGLANSIEARDPYTAGHTNRVSQLAELIAIELGWDGRRIHDLIVGCTLHDIGKIGVPDSILNKQGRLTDDERATMNDHPMVGLKIITGIELFKPAIPYIVSHHEWYNGAGYPNGLKGEAIPIEGRLLTVADTFDAIMSDRPYRKGRSLDCAISELLKYRGIQFDPRIVDVFIRIIQTGKVDFEGMYGRSEDVTVIDRLLLSETAPA